MGTVQLDPIGIHGRFGEPIGDEEERRRASDAALRALMREGEAAQAIEDAQTAQPPPAAPGLPAERSRAPMAWTGAPEGQPPPRPQPSDVERIAEVQERLDRGGRYGVEADVAREAGGSVPRGVTASAAADDEAPRGITPRLPGMRAGGVPVDPSIIADATGDRASAPGRLEPGNIDLRHRPQVRNPDGSISTVRSRSFGTDRGEMLVPTVSEDGRIMEDREALDTARRTGRHLGIFATPDSATRYAEGLHEDQAAALSEGSPRKPERPPPADIRDGLPTDSDISRAEGTDALRRVAHVLGSAFNGALGRAPTPFRSEADALRERRESGIERGQSAKREALQTERQGRALDVQARGQELEGEHSERADAIAAAREQSRARRDAAQAEFDAARTTSERARAARALQATDPDSAESGRARARYVLEELPRRLRLEGGDREALRSTIEREVQGFSVADIEAMEGELAGMSLGTRGHGGGGGAGARAPGREGVSRAQAAQERIAAATARGIDPAAAEQLERDGDLARITAQDALTRGPQARAEQYGERLQQSGLAQADEALRAVEAYASAHPGDLPGQGPIDTLGGLRPQFTQSPEAREFQRLTRRLLDSQLRQATGANAPESEVQTFRQILGLSESSSDEDVRAALQQARDYIDSEYNALRGAYGPEAIAEWERRARATRGAGTQATVRAPQAADEVRVIERSSRRSGRVPRAEFEEDQRRPARERRYRAVE